MFISDIECSEINIYIFFFDNSGLFGIWLAVIFRFEKNFNFVFRGLPFFLYYYL